MIPFRMKPSGPDPRGVPSTRSRAGAPRALRSGFTLLEVMAAIFLTAVTIAAAVSFQIQLGDATTAARDRIRVQRHAVAILDRVARDLQGSYLLVKSPEVDPLDHPWLFMGERLEDTDGEGANAVKFVTRNHRPYNIDGPTSDVAMVAYYLDEQERIEEEDERRPGYRLMRWVTPRLPESLDRSFPEPDDESANVIAEDIASFGLTFIDIDGNETDEWDSSQLEQSGEIPLAVRIEVGMMDPDTGEPVQGLTSEGEEAQIVSRLVMLPMRPIEFAILTEQSITFAEKFGIVDEDDAAGEDPLDESCEYGNVSECVGLLLADGEIDQDEAASINARFEGGDCIDELDDSAFGSCRE